MLVKKTIKNIYRYAFASMRLLLNNNLFKLKNNHWGTWQHLRTSMTSRNELLRQNVLTSQGLQLNITKKMTKTILFITREKVRAFFHLYG